MKSISHLRYCSLFFNKAVTNKPAKLRLSRPVRRLNRGTASILPGLWACTCLRKRRAKSGCGHPLRRRTRKPA
jgi:hypothetical protein